MKNIKKLLSLLLCGIMLFGMFPASLFAADGDTGDGSGTISETIVPEITWKRTLEYKHRHNDTEHQYTNLGGLYASDKTDYLVAPSWSPTPSPSTTPDPSATPDPSKHNTLSWDWNTVRTALNRNDDEATNVWDYGTENQYADPKTTSLSSPEIGDVGIAPYTPAPSESPILAATWNNRTDQDYEISSTTVPQGSMDLGYGKSYTVRKFSGEFLWPEGYDLGSDIEIISKNDSYYQEIYAAVQGNDELKAAFGGKKVFAANDDVYFFIYKASDASQVTASNYLDYLAFFSGTAGKGIWSWSNGTPYFDAMGGTSSYNGWGVEWNCSYPGTFGTQYATRAFNNCLPNLDTVRFGETGTRTGFSDKLKSVMSFSGGWYSFIDGDSLSTVLNNKYGETGINADEKICIDIYCFDTEKVGGMDELEIRLTRQKPTTSSVTVRYWLNEVGEITDTTKYLGQSVMTGQTIGSQITLVDGTDVNQLNHKKAAAIAKNGNNDVADGVQIELPFTVTEKSEDNIINVVYVPAGNKVVHLWAGSLEVPYDGLEHVVHDVKITQDGCADITVSDSETTTSYQLADGTRNQVTNITAQRKEIYPGIYVVDFARTSTVTNTDGTVLGNYSIIYHPGTLKITYAPPDKTFVYDFGVQNSYKLTDVEEKAVGIKTVDENVKHVGFNDTDKSILYTPQSVNKGETIQTKLVFTGNYITEATSITFLPATKRNL